MHVVDRILLWLYAMVVGVLALAAALWAAGWEMVAQWAARMDPAAVLAVSLILLVLSLRFLFLRNGSRDPASVVLRRTEGDVSISLVAIEQMASRMARQIRGVDELRAMVRPDGERVAIRLKVIVKPDVAIPPLIEQLQQSVRQYVEQTSGLRVSDVRVHVSGVAGEVLWRGNRDRRRVL
ncbi:MAG: alkaline shock response membrane anchor protein AmaP [Alicyclobacillaceae bacterium]|nr:alkaline shock response membrane anchor protein AmaP [Alicyclobacillaceae bacterium]